MSGPPRLRSLNIADTEPAPPRSVLGPGGNKARPTEARKPASKPVKKSEKPVQEPEKKASAQSPSQSPQCASKSPSILARKQSHHGLVNFPMSASCSSDASSSDSSHSGKAAAARRSAAPPPRRKQCGTKAEKVEKVETESVLVHKVGGNVVATADSEDCFDSKKKCAWITHNTDQCYVAFHDEEWGVPVRDDKKLFEYLSLSGALAELTWPTILNKRRIFREVFLDFDPIAVSKLSEKKVTAPGSFASSLLSELKLRAIIENARQMCKVIEEFGSFDKYMWNFVNHKPMVSQYRYPRQVPVKTPKAEVISKDLVRRGFRSVGPTVVYTFMQVAGLTNDHLITCFRVQECLATLEGKGDTVVKSKIDEQKPDKTTDQELLARALDEHGLISK